MRIPRNLKELQGLLGKLLYASTFIVDYKRLVQPVEALLTEKGTAVWTE